MITTACRLQAGSGPNSLRSGPSSASGINLVGLVDGGQRPAGHSRSQSFSNAADSPKVGGEGVSEEPDLV